MVLDASAGLELPSSARCPSLTEPAVPKPCSIPSLPFRAGRAQAVLRSFPPLSSRPCQAVLHLYGHPQMPAAHFVLINCLIVSLPAFFTFWCYSACPGSSDLPSLLTPSPSAASSPCCESQGLAPGAPSSRVSHRRCLTRSREEEIAALNSGCTWGFFRQSSIICKGQLEIRLTAQAPQRSGTGLLREYLSYGKCLLNTTLPTLE